jgi:hypothetical protein
MPRPVEQIAGILSRHDWREQTDRRECRRAIGKSLDKIDMWVPPGAARRFDAAVRRVL